MRISPPYHSRITLMETRLHFCLWCLTAGLYRVDSALRWNAIFKNNNNVSIYVAHICSLGPFTSYYPWSLDRFIHVPFPIAGEPCNHVALETCRTHNSLCPTRCSLTPERSEARARGQSVLPKNMTSTYQCPNFEWGEALYSSENLHQAEIEPARHK